MGDLLRESSVYKKAMIALATAGVGFMVYTGYRRWTVSRGQLSTPDTVVQPTGQSTAKATVDKNVLPTPAVRTSKDSQPAHVADHSKQQQQHSHVDTSPAGWKPPVTSDDLSSSGTFEKVSLSSHADPNKSLASSGVQESFVQLSAADAVHPHSAGTSPQPHSLDSFEQLSLSQVHTADNRATTSGASTHTTSTTPTRVKVKDENDIVVIEKNSDSDNGVEGARVFDPARETPVFGGQAYKRLRVDVHQLDKFDPAKVHPASVGFELLSAGS